MKKHILGTVRNSNIKNAKSVSLNMIKVNKAKSKSPADNQF